MNLNQIRKTLVLDIETASISKDFKDLSVESQLFWKKKALNLRRHENKTEVDLGPEVLYHQKAAIFAEFGKVICISVGIFEIDEGIKSFRVKSFYGDDESEILNSFQTLLNDYFYDKYHHTLAGHNLKEFDIPFLCRRMVIHGMKLPNLLRIQGARPWQVPHLLDTLELWKFGDYKNYASLDLLCDTLSIPSPKDKMDGSQVSEAYWNGQLDDVKVYCEKDLVATARVLLRLMGGESLDDSQVMYLKDDN